MKFLNLIGSTFQETSGNNSTDKEIPVPDKKPDSENSGDNFGKSLKLAFCQPALGLLIVAATFRHAGQRFSWFVS